MTSVDPHQGGRMGKELQESVERMKALVTDEMVQDVRTRCAEAGKPFVDPVEYYVFMQEWAATQKITAESAVQRCERSADPEDMTVAPSVYQDILREYAEKTAYLHAILSRGQSAGGETLPRIDDHALQVADKAFAAFMEAYPAEEFAEKCATADRQRLLLSQNIGILKEHVWPKIEAAALPLRRAGTDVLKAVSDEVKKREVS